MQRTKKNIVIGQPVSDVKADRAKKMRREPTLAESLLWQRLRRNQVGRLHFRRQQPIDGFIVDFYCHSLGLVIEIDGPIHATQQSSDHERDAILADRGLHVLRISNDDVQHDIVAVLGRISNIADSLRNRASVRSTPKWCASNGSLLWLDPINDPNEEVR